MQIDRLEVFKESAKIEGSYDESKFKSILDENYENFCNFCEDINEKYDNIDSVNCTLDDENHEINFNISSNGINENFVYKY